ncbi:hypothetical protein QOZ94_003706 [Xanthobacter agilis]|uniref:Luciferase-like domain-containing protein n=1 Tax=Xanthobacter agilis TaxID=47492 RepID=A0ABU0LIC1_XANAG|nr:hypothetical protein [Xanthobacter agilis]
MSALHEGAGSPDFFWFIPTHGDGAYLGSETRQRPPEFAYFREVAQAVDRLGFKGVLLPTGQSCEDSWITAAGLATATERCASWWPCARVSPRRLSRRGRRRRLTGSATDGCC